MFLWCSFGLQVAIACAVPVLCLDVRSVSTRHAIIMACSYSSTGTVDMRHTQPLCT